MKKLYIVFASQEYERANHKSFWVELSKLPETEVLVVNIPADYIVSIIKRRYDRIKDAKGGMKKISDSMYIYRPIFLLRPEINLKAFRQYISKSLFRQINDIGFHPDNYEFRILFYNAFWCEYLENIHIKATLVYYLFDEVRYNAHTNIINRKRYKEDEYACEHSDLILAMTQSLADSRKQYNRSILVFGNGAICPNDEKSHIYTHAVNNAIGFIGNFRNWIDKELLKDLITNRQDLHFFFAGPIEDDMKEYFYYLLNTFSNVFYCGVLNKSRITDVYKFINCTIVPYKQNSFMSNTRPIKIVESVFNGTPVVTIPINGYKECTFIQFADDYASFSTKIDYVLEHRIDPNDTDFMEFCEVNKWSTKAAKLDAYLNSKK